MLMEHFVAVMGKIAARPVFHGPVRSGARVALMVATVAAMAAAKMAMAMAVVTMAMVIAMASARPSSVADVGCPEEELREREEIPLRDVLAFSPWRAARAPSRVTCAMALSPRRALTSARREAGAQGEGCYPLARSSREP